jgi:hypothetical protein
MGEKRMQGINLGLIIILALAIIAIGLGWSSWKGRYLDNTSSETTPAQILSRFPVHDLILQEVNFDIITKAQLDDAGNPILYFVSAGAFGRGSTKLILFRGCVRVRYGLNLTNLQPDVSDVDRGVITIHLPQPQIIGQPIILTEPNCESRILDVQGEGWWAGYVQRAEVQTRIHQEYAKNAPRLCDGLDLERKTKERAEQVLRAFLGGLVTEQGWTLVIHWPEETPNERNTEQGMKGTGDDDNSAENNFAMRGDDISGGVGLFPWHTSSSGEVWPVPSPILWNDDRGHAGDAFLDFPGRTFRGVPDGIVRPAGPEWLPAE